MLVINDNNMKLLKMKEKLLEVSTDGSSSLLDDYQSLVYEIDNDYYNQIINKIDKSNYSVLSFEEQIAFLSEIEEDYNYLNQFQWRIKKTYDKYADKEIELTDINNILIDNIIKRKSDIQGYLINNKNIDSNKIELDRLNYKLIQLDKGNENAKKICNEIKNKLRDEIIKAEGRSYGANGNMNAVSIMSELKKYEIDLKALVNDSDYLSRTLNELKTAFDEQERMLETAYNLPNRIDDVYNQMRYDTNICHYKYLLVKLVDAVCLSKTDYTSFKDTLYDVLNIINEIKSVLKELGYKYYINPFDRIKIDNHIQVINSITDYGKEISDIKRTITYLAQMIEETTKRNRELIQDINTDVELVKGTSRVETYVTDYEQFVDDKVLRDTTVKDNQVINVRNTTDDFKIERVHEKTDGVINRVYEMINNIPVLTDEYKTPELVLEPIQIDMEDKSNDIFEDIGDLKDESSVFLDDHKSDDLTTKDNDDVIINEPPLKDNQDDLFQEVQPFEETPLFSDKYDTDIFNDNKSNEMIIDLSDAKKGNTYLDDKENIIELGDKEDNIIEPKMPDAFWVTKEDTEKEEKDNILSFDEQVAALMESKEPVKTKKKVA